MPPASPRSRIPVLSSSTFPAGAEILPPSAEERARARVGMAVDGKYVLDDLLAVGSTTAVYAATHRNRSRVAIKMLHAELSADAAIGAKFLRQGYAANKVNHRGVVRVLDDDVAEDGAVYLVMELLEGETLGQRLQKVGGPLPIAEALRIGWDVADILVAAHEIGIEHHDIGPSNVWLGADGSVKLIDFGDAFLTAGPATISAPAPRRSDPAYAAPETSDGDRTILDVRADVYSIGAILWGMFVGKDPDGRTLVETRGDLTPSIVALVDCAMAEDARRRWPNVATLREMITIARSELSPRDAESTAELAPVYPSVRTLALGLPMVPIDEGPMESESSGPRLVEKAQPPAPPIPSALLPPRSALPSLKPRMISSNPPRSPLPSVASQTPAPSQPASHSSALAQALAAPPPKTPKIARSYLAQPIVIPPLVYAIMIILCGLALIVIALLW